MTISGLMLGVLLSLVGGAFVAYGKRQSELMPLFSGFGMITVAMVVSNKLVLVIAGLALAAMAFIY